MSVVQFNNIFKIEEFTATHNKLPVGNYLLQYSDRDGFYLQKKEPFKLPSKLYGDHTIVDRWLRSWKQNSNKNMGVLLSGIKGSGKTITAQKFCIDSNLPVIMINEQSGGGPSRMFLNFLSDAKLGECIIFIDEFEKVYEARDAQNEILTLMDGMFETKLVFLFTVNELRVSEYFTNRLNRIKYHKAYGDLTDDEVSEIVDDMLINKSHKESVFEFLNKVNMRTYDLIVNVIKEMNLFDEDAITCGKHLNLAVQEKKYEVFEIFNGVEYECYSTNLIPTANASSASGGDTVIYLQRKRIDYLTKDTTIGFGSNKAKNYDEYDGLERIGTDDWEVRLDRKDCTFENRGSMILLTSKGLQFRLKEVNPTLSLVF